MVPTSPYIKRLRDVIGTDLIFIPAVSVLAVDDDRVLLVYEVDQEAWSTPGGAMEVDERPRRRGPPRSARGDRARRRRSATS